MRTVLWLAFSIALASPMAHADAPLCDEPRLSEAAAALLIAHGTALPSATELVDAARIAGSNAVALRAMRGASFDVALDGFAVEARTREGAATVCGEAENEHGRLRIVGREGARLSTTLVDEGRAIDVRLVAPGDAPRLVVRAPDGAAFERELRAAEERIPLPPGFSAAFVAQVIASDRHGPRPSAELVAGIPQRAEQADVGDEDAAIHLERIRRHAGVASLRRNTILDRVALAHARAVCAEGRAVHTVDGEDPVARVRRAGLEARLVGEAVARATGRAEALAALDASPSHRLTLEDPRYTDAGVAEFVAEDAHVCTVVLLAAWPRFAGR